VRTEAGLVAARRGVLDSSPMPLSMELLERLVEASPDIVVATDRHGTVCYYNDGARANLGFLRDEIIGRDVVQLYPSLEEARRVMAAMRDPNVDARGRIVNFPTRFISKDDREIPVAISGAIIYDEQGDEEGTIGFAKDISEIARKDQLAVLGEIAVGLSHEINNPLAVIVNHLDLLERYLRRSAAADDFEVEGERIIAIRSAVERIEAQLDRLREMSQSEQYASREYLGAARMIDLDAPSLEEHPLEGRRVLVVDDDAAVRDSVACMLIAERCQVVAAHDALAALAELDRQPFDFVLSDVVMPGMDGYELFHETKRRRPETSVVLMTAFYYDRDHVLKRSRIAGLQGVLFKKPVRPERLRATLVSLLKSPPRAPS
jgi:PAS domain S-box-containing protein